jgi:chemotaxis signal transduction protein
MDFLACRLGPMQLGIPRTAVLEVLEVGELSAVPGSQPWVGGVALVRGTATLFVALDGQRTRHAKAVRVPVAASDVIVSGATSRTASSSFLALLVDDTGRFVDVESADRAASDAAIAALGTPPYFSNFGRISVGTSGIVSATVGGASVAGVRAVDLNIWMFQPHALAKVLG